MIRRINMCIFLLLLFFFLLFWIDISALKICADRKTAPLVSDWSSGYSGLVPNTQATAARIPPIPPRRKKRLDSIRQTNQTGQVPPSFPIQLPFFKHIFYAIISNIYIYIYIYSSQFLTIFQPDEKDSKWNRRQNAHQTLTMVNE